MSHLSGGQTSWAPGDGRGPRKRIDDRVRWLLGRGKAVRGRNPHCPAQEKAATEPTDRTEAIKASRGARSSSSPKPRGGRRARPRLVPVPPPHPARRGLRHRANPRRVDPSPLLCSTAAASGDSGPGCRELAGAPLACRLPPPVLVWLLSSRFGGFRAFLCVTAAWGVPGSDRRAHAHGVDCC